MAFLRQIPGTELKVSALGLGTVKFGRDQSVKYPEQFTIPDDGDVINTRTGRIRRYLVCRTGDVDGR